MLSSAHAIAMGDELVNCNAHCIDRLLKARQFARNILSNKLFYNNARFVQQHMSKTNAFNNWRAFKRCRTIKRKIARVLDCLQFARSDEFRKQHRRSLKRFDFFFRVNASNFILYDQYAKRIAAA